MSWLACRACSASCPPCFLPSCAECFLSSFAAACESDRWTSACDWWARSKLPPSICSFASRPIACGPAPATDWRRWLVGRRTFLPHGSATRPGASFSPTRACAAGSGLPACDCAACSANCSAALRALANDSRVSRREASALAGLPPRETLGGSPAKAEASRRETRESLANARKAAEQLAEQAAQSPAGKPDPAAQSARGRKTSRRPSRRSMRQKSPPANQPATPISRCAGPQAIGRGKRANRRRQFGAGAPIAGRRRAVALASGGETR